MRAELCKQLLERAASQKNMVFLTGDLGFMALEPLRDIMGDRFINCGVAEQNMIGVAAAMAKEGLEVWVYSIAPFCYARPFEHIRNDICVHGLPVHLLGNGGGYGYGVMGATHHALEDYGVLLTLPGMHVYAPAFDEDIGPVIAEAGKQLSPSYIRLGMGTPLAGKPVPAYAPWRQLTNGGGPVVLTIGPLGGHVQQALASMPSLDAELWLACELPFTATTIPQPLHERLTKGSSLCVIEEHVAHGGLGSLMCQWLVKQGISLNNYQHICAQGYPSGRSGSHNYLRAQSGLDQDSIRATLQQMMKLDVA